MLVEFMPKSICVFGHQNCEKRSVLEIVYEIQIFMIVRTQLLVNPVVLHALQTDDLSLHRIASSCMFDIMQFRQHDARDKR